MYAKKYSVFESRNKKKLEPEHSECLSYGFFSNCQRAWNIQKKKMRINAVCCLAFHSGAVKIVYIVSVVREQYVLNMVHSTIFFIIWKQNENIIAGKAIKHDLQMETDFIYLVRCVFIWILCAAFPLVPFIIIICVKIDILAVSAYLLRYCQLGSRLNSRFSLP